MRSQVVVLAAGHSRRMGHPKALTDVGGGEPALSRIVRTCEAAGLARPVVVLGVHHDEVRAALAALDVAWVRNPDPDEGRTGSLQRGLLAAGGASQVLVWPVDHPLVDARTLQALLAAEGAWVVPEHGGRGGHPVKLAGMGVTAVETAPPRTPLRDVPRMLGLEPTRIRVDDEAIRWNLDTPTDVARHRRT